VHNWLCSQKIFFSPPWNPGISEKLEHLHWTWWGLCWKVMKCLKWLCIFS
jgi:hypothetical protein